MGKINIKENDIYQKYKDEVDKYFETKDAFREKYRLGYHLSPPIGWLNDPNGLVYHDGIYHIYYQYSAPFFVNCTWAHITTRDFLNFTYHPLAIYPEKGEGIWSGSVVYDTNNDSGFFDANGGFVSIYTRFLIENNHQQQEIGYSNDGIYYERYKGNPVIPNTENIWAFRDPKVFWYEQGNKWIAIVAGGIVRFYSSPDLINWNYESENAEIETECPDIYPLPLDHDSTNIKWVLSLGGRSYCVGDFDGHRFIPITKIIPMNVGTDFYASQTFDNIPLSDGRRIAMSWMDCWDNVNRPYQSLTIPISITLRTNKNKEMRVYQYPINELNILRGNRFYQENILIPNNEEYLCPFASKRCEIFIDATCSCSDFQIHVLKTGDESTIVGYLPASSEVYVDRGNSGIMEYTSKSPSIQLCSILRDETIRFKILVDEGSIEVFINEGEQLISMLVYPIGDAGMITCKSIGGETHINKIEIYDLRAITIEKGEFDF